MKKVTLAAVLMMCTFTAQAEHGYTEIFGSVESRCMIVSETSGVYGNPTPNVLTTDPANGGVKPVIRYDVINAEFYKARIMYPTYFSSAPYLDDVVEWTGSVQVSEVSDAGMSDYDTNKVEYNNVTEYDLTIAGSTWFQVTSAADYGYNKSYPAGNYNAVVELSLIHI